MENITLTINDLASLRSVIDLASTRGAFRANELKEVGEIYDRLHQFIEASIATAQAQHESRDNPSTEGQWVSTPATETDSSAKGE
jgi:hypothetical protein